MSKYKTAPDPEFTGWPPGVPYIIGNEGCERFSFYGMKSILQVHLTILFAIQMGLGTSYEAAEAFINAGGADTEAAKASAQGVVHLFIAGVYALPMIGALIADKLWGKFNTILWLSLVYCAGHAVLAVGENDLVGMYIGLALIAMGSGGIKPCVSANVGDQFGKGNWFRVEKVFQAFYFIINFGSFFATLLIPWIRARFGNSVAFGIPGVLMFVATVLFWSGRKKFIHIPPRPGGPIALLDTASASLLFFTFGSLFFTAGRPLWLILTVSISSLVAGLALFGYRQSIQSDDGFLAVMFHALRRGFRAAREHFGDETVDGPIAVLRIISVFFLVSVFWALFDQHASSWIRQAQDMNLHVNLGIWDGDLLPSQIQALNPLMVMGLIPFASFILYPTVTKLGFEMRPLRRMAIGMFVAGGAYVTVALIQAKIDAEGRGVVSFAWQIIPYLIITMSEVMVSITGLEFAYTQAPKRMKSTIMGFWLMTVALGNVLVAVLTHFMPDDMGLTEAFWMYAGLMAAAASIFSVMAFLYKGRDYSQ